MRAGRIHGLFGLVLSSVVAVSSPMAGAQPKDSVEIIVKGCLKGRELTAMEVASDEDLPQHVGAIFRLSAKGDLDKAVRAENGHLVSVTGLVKKTALAEQGLKVGGARIFVGGSPRSTDPTRDPARNPSTRLFPMQVSAVSRVADSCARFP